MKIKLSTGFEYDLSQSGEVANLRKNISTMKSRKQFDRLADLYRKLQSIEIAKAGHEIKANVAKLCAVLVPLVSQLQSTLISSDASKTIVPAKTKTTKKTVPPFRQEVVRQLPIEQKTLARNVIYGRPDKAPITISYRNDQGKNMHAAFFDHYTMRRATAHYTNIALAPHLSIYNFQQFAETVVHELAVTVEDRGKRIVPLVIADSADESGLLFIPGRPREGADKERRKYEKQLIKKALNRGQPILAVCAGSWQLWKAFGGTTQSVLDHCYASMPRIGVNGDVVNNVQIHRIKLTANTIVAGAMQIKSVGAALATRPKVNSVHWEAPDEKNVPALLEISAVARVDEGLAPNSRSGKGQMQPTRGSVEAFEMKHGVPTVGIQWHPEACFKYKQTLEDKRHSNILKTMAEAGDAYQAKRKMLREFKEKASVGFLLKATGVFRQAAVAEPIAPAKRAVVSDDKSLDKDSIHYGRR